LAPRARICAGMERAHARHIARLPVGQARSALDGPTDVANDPGSVAAMAAYTQSLLDHWHSPPAEVAGALGRSRGSVYRQRYLLRKAGRAPSS
jgi:hypothetical protein